MNRFDCPSISQCCQEAEIDRTRQVISSRSLVFRSCGWWRSCLGSICLWGPGKWISCCERLHSLVPPKSQVSEENHITLWFVYRSWVNVSESSFAEGALSNCARNHRKSRFPGLFHQLWGVCVVINLHQCSHQTFSRLRQRLSSFVRLIARCPC